MEAKIAKNLLIISLFCIIFALFYSFYQKVESLAEQLEPQPIQEPHYRVVYLMPSATDHFWDQVYLGMTEFAQKNNIVIDVRSGVQFGVPEMVKQMNRAINSKVDGIIVPGINHPDFIQVINQATQKGIPVITVGIDVSNSLRKMYIGSDHFTSGERLAQLIVDDLKGKGVIGIIGSQQSTTLQSKRLEGIRTMLLVKPELQVYEQIYESKLEQQHSQAIENMNQLLNRAPALQAVVVLNGSEIDSITQVLRQRWGSKQPKIYTFDDTSKTIDFYKTRHVTGLVMQTPEDIGRMSIENLYAWLTGKQLPLPSQIYTPIQLKHLSMEMKIDENDSR